MNNTIFINSQILINSIFKPQFYLPVPVKKQFNLKAHLLQSNGLNEFLKKDSIRIFSLLSYNQQNMIESFLQSIHAIVNSINAENEEPLLSIKQRQIRVAMASVDLNRARNIYKQLSHRHRKGQQYGYKRNWKIQQLQFSFYVIDKFCYLNRQSLQDLTEQQWNQIAVMIPGRQAAQLKFKILSLTKYSLNEYPWQKQQEEIFLNIVQQEGVKWDNVSKKLHEKGKSKVFRNSKQCRQHYLCFLNPQMKKGFWQDQQDYSLVSLYIKYGRKWAKMSRIISGRNQNAIKNRFFLLVQNKCKREFSWIKQQNGQSLNDKYLIQAMNIRQKIQKKIGRQKAELINQAIAKNEENLRQKQQGLHISSIQIQVKVQKCSQYQCKQQPSIFIKKQQQKKLQNYSQKKQYNMDSEQFWNLLIQ